MKKTVLLICLLITSVVAHAQFEKGKWIINPSLSGLDLSYSKETKTHFGLEFQTGAFLIDNLALMVNMGADFSSDRDAYSVGVGGRYYFNSYGIYLGTGFKYKRIDWDNAGKRNDFVLASEAGYAFFLTRTVTLEPVIYYDLSFKDSDYSKLGFRLGLSFYF